VHCVVLIAWRTPNGTTWRTLVPNNANSLEEIDLTRLVILSLDLHCHNHQLIEIGVWVFVLTDKVCNRGDVILGEGLQMTIADRCHPARFKSNVFWFWFFSSPWRGIGY